MQLLIETRADGNDHAPAVFELLRKRLRHLARCACDDDRIKRRDFRPTLKTVAHFHVCVAITEPGQTRRRLFRKRLDDLDRVNIFDELGQDGALITGAGSNFENTIRRLRTQLFGHEPDDERLGNGLVVPDRQRAVQVGLCAHVFRKECFPRHFRHRG